MNSINTRSYSLHFHYFYFYVKRKHSKENIMHYNKYCVGLNKGYIYSSCCF